MTFSSLKNPQFRRALLITIFGAFFCFLPNLLRLKINDSEYENSMELSPLQQTLSSTSFKVCEAISMAAAFPILFDFIMDSFVYSAKDINPSKLAIWLLLLTSIIPNIVTFFYVIPNMRTDLLVLLPTCRTIPLLFSGLWLLNTYGPSIWGWKLIEPVMLIHSISTVISAFKPFVEDPELRILLIIRFSFYALGGLIVTYMCLRWLYHLYTIRRDSKSFTPDQLTCTWNMFAFIALMISTIVVQYYLGDYLSVKAGPVIFNTRLYCITAFILVVTALTGRYERSKVLLQHARHEAELKRSLVGYISHEIRTPLNSILMGLQVMKDEISLGMDTSVLSDFITSLLLSGDATVEILDSLLTFDNLDQNCMELTMKQLSVAHILSRYYHYDDKRVTLQMNLSPPLIHNSTSTSNRSGNGNSNSNERQLACITADEFHFGKVIQTLVSNATECTPTTGTNISSRLCSRCYWRSPAVADRSYLLQVEVTDSGSSLTKEQEDEVLENPFSFTAGVLQTHQGQGLGLWISRRIVQLHKGELTVKSLSTGSGSGSGSTGSTGSTYIIRIPVFFTDSKHGDDVEKKPSSVRRFLGSLSRQLSERRMVVTNRHRHVHVHGHSNNSSDLRRQISLHSIPPRHSSGEYVGRNSSSTYSGGGGNSGPYSIPVSGSFSGPLPMPVLSFSRDMTDDNGEKSGDYRQAMNRFSALGLSLLNIGDAFCDHDRDRDRENMSTEYNIQNRSTPFKHK
eukprot:gene9100-18860_t